MIQIMIVDDHALVREGYIRLINSDRRFKVIGSAKSGEDAVSQLNKISPDVLITDMSMPGMSGLSVIVNALALHPNLKIILCSMRKLPHQVDNSKLEIPVLNVLGMNSMGVLSPRESWGLNSL